MTHSLAGSFFLFYFQKAVREKRNQLVKHNKKRSPERMKLKSKVGGKKIITEGPMTMIYTTARIFLVLQYQRTISTNQTEQMAKYAFL